MRFSKFTFHYLVGPNCNELFHPLLSPGATVAHFYTCFSVFFIFFFYDNKLPQLPVIAEPSFFFRTTNEQIHGSLWSEASFTPAF